MRAAMVGLVLGLSVLANAGSSAALMDEVALLGALVQDVVGATDAPQVVDEHLPEALTVPTGLVAGMVNSAAEFGGQVVAEAEVKQSLLANTAAAIVDNAALLAQQAPGLAQGEVASCGSSVESPLPGTWAEVRERCASASGLAHQLLLVANALIAQNTQGLLNGTEVLDSQVEDLDLLLARTVDGLPSL